MTSVLGKQFNALEMIKDRGLNPTFTDEEYLNLANQAADEVRFLCSNLSLWNVHSSKDGIDVRFLVF